jgi:hypothetical protein
VPSMAVIHAYVWMLGHSFPGVGQDAHIQTRRQQLEGYDAAVFGDNHKGFLSHRVGKKFHRTAIFNCGTFLRRTTTEVDYRPLVGIYDKDGRISKHFLDTSADIIVATDNEAAVQQELDASGIVQEISKSADVPINFKDAVRHELDKVHAKRTVRQLTTQAMEQ